MPRIRTWYGLPADVSVQGRGWHDVRMGPFALPHPALINLFLRKGLPRDIRSRMTHGHEVGHLQALPLALCHAVWLGRRLRSTPGSPSSSAARFGAAVLVHAAAWELFAETWTWLENRRSYRLQSKWRRGAFWGSMVGVVLGGTLFLASSRRATLEARPGLPLRKTTGERPSNIP